MKKINCIMFIMFMIIFISSFSVKATVNNTTTYKYKEFFYIYRGENIQIIDYYGKKSKVIVPSEIEGRKVVKFGYNFYKDKKYYENNVDSLMLWGFIDDVYVKEIYFPNSIKEIEGMSFVNCKNLKKVVLGNGIKHLDNTTFLNCKNLEQLKLSESLDEFECCIIDDTKVKRISKINTFFGNKSYIFKYIFCVFCIINFIESNKTTCPFILLALYNILTNTKSKSAGIA